MITGPDNLFALPEPTALLRGELARVPAHAAARPAGMALIVQACAAHRQMKVDTRHLRALRVHADAGALRGDVDCAADALPFEDGAFQFVVAQHAGDALPASPLFVGELARVLAPGGTLLWFGFNPWSPWLMWLHWRARGGLPVPVAMGPDALRRRLAASGLAAGSSQLFGSCWPSQDGDGMVAPLRAAWSMTADKRRAVLTPLHARRQRSRVSARPSLVVPSRRICA